MIVQSIRNAFLTNNKFTEKKQKRKENKNLV